MPQLNHNTTSNKKHIHSNNSNKNNPILLVNEKAQSPNHKAKDVFKVNACKSNSVDIYHEISNTSNDPLNNLNMSDIAAKMQFLNKHQQFNSQYQLKNQLLNLNYQKQEYSQQPHAHRSKSSKPVNNWFNVGNELSNMRSCSVDVNSYGRVNFDLIELNFDII